MTSMRGLYALVRYTTDALREDGVTVGALLVYPSAGYLRGLIPFQRESRLRCYDPSYRPWVIDNLKEEVAALRRTFLNVRSMDAALDFLRDMRTEWPFSVIAIGEWKDVYFQGKATVDELDHCLAEIVRREVLWYRDQLVASESLRGPGFRERVSEMLQKSGLLRPEDPASFVKIRFQVDDSGIRHPFGYTNGRKNVIEVADLSKVKGRTEDALMSEAEGAIARLAATITEHGDRVGRITLVSGKHRIGHDEAATVRTLRSLSDDVYYVDEDQDWRGFVRRIEEDRRRHA